MELRGKRALVTGATGFIGGQVAERLITQEGVRVRALARTPEKGRWLADLGAEILTGDIRNPVSLSEAVADCQLVFHAAAWVSETGPRSEVWAVNVEGTHHVVEAALDRQAERFVHLSSCAVYGSLPQFNISETTPTRMSGRAYADSKVAAETILFRAYRERGLPVVVARASQVYGPRSPQFTIRPVEVIKAGKMVLVDEGRYMCKPAYIDNLVDGLILCAKIDAAVGHAINLTDGVAVPWRDFLGAYAAMLGVASLPSVPYGLAWFIGLTNEVKAAVSGKSASLNRRVVRALRSNNSFSNQKAKTMLGWEPEVDFVEGMQRTESWLRVEGYLSQ